MNWTPIASNEPNDFSYDWTVNDVSSAQCRVRVRARDAWNNLGSDLSDANFTITATTDVTSEPNFVPRRFALHPAQPNPFNPTTRLQFDLVARSAVHLEVLAVDGRVVRQLIAGRGFDAGRHAVIWDGRDDSGRGAAAGVYVLRLRAGDASVTRKVQLVK